MPIIPAQQENGLVIAPHVVILGAGASIAMTLLNSELGHKKLPSMNDLVEVVGLSSLLEEHCIEYRSENFEELFSRLNLDAKYKKLTDEIEVKIYNYFASMQISDDVTIYDYLVMSLTKNDVIATFNWDPFLIQSLARCSQYTHNLPRLIFLHGNVGVGVCYEDTTVGHMGKSCSRCGNLFEASPLLYPIDKKDYSANLLIKSEWDTLRHYLDTAYFVTIYGYSAPVSDYEAKKLMLDIWEKNKSMEIAEFEIIDIQDEEKLLNTWEEFIYNGHVMISDNIFNSYLFNHPRRATTDLFQMTMMLNIQDENPIKKCKNLNELYNFVKPLIEAEEDEHKSIINI